MKLGFRRVLRKVIQRLWVNEGVGNLGGFFLVFLLEFEDALMN